MKNEQGFISTGVIIAIIAVLGITVGGAGYVAYKKSMPNVQVTPDGVSVQTDGLNVNTGSDGVSVQTDGLNVNTGSDGVSVQTDGLNVNTGSDGVSVNMNNGAQEVESGQEITPSINTVLVFDASGSMAVQSKGGKRIDIAKKAVSDYVNKLDDDVNLSVVVYGHKGDNTQAGKDVSCKGIEEVYYMGPVNTNIITSKVNALHPNGWTPITNALKKAENILNRSSNAGKKYIVLLSDGKETCGGDPVAYAKKLCSEGIVVDVIGLDVNGVAESQLKSVSLGGCGEYYSVNGANDFSAVINDMGIKVNTGNVKVNISGDSARVQTGDIDVQTNNDGAKVDAGNIHVDTTGGSPTVDVPGVSIPSF